MVEKPIISGGSIMKTLFLTLIFLLSTFSFCSGGELRQKMFPDIQGNPVYEYQDGEYRGEFRQKMLPDVFGNPVYEYRDNQGNRRTIKQKMLPDIQGNPVYEIR